MSLFLSGVLASLDVQGWGEQLWEQDSGIDILSLGTTGRVAAGTFGVWQFRLQKSSRNGWGGGERRRSMDPGGSPRVLKVPRLWGTVARGSLGPPRVHCVSSGATRRWLPQSGAHAIQNLSFWWHLLRQDLNESFVEYFVSFSVVIETIFCKVKNTCKNGNEMEQFT